MASCRALAVAPELSGLAALSRLLAAPAARRAPADGLQRYAEIVERIGSAGADLALLGLLDVCGLLAEAIGAIVTSRADLSAEVLQGLHDWIPIVQQYTANPGEEHASQALLDHVRRPCWGVTMSDAEATSLLEALRMVPARDEDAPQPPAELDVNFDALEEACIDIELDEAPLIPQEYVATVVLSPVAGAASPPVDDALFDVLLDEPAVLDQPAALDERPAADDRAPLSEPAPLDEFALFDEPAMLDEPASPDPAAAEEHSIFDEPASPDPAPAAERSIFDTAPDVLAPESQPDCVPEELAAVAQPRPEPAAAPSTEQAAAPPPPPSATPPAIQALLTVLVDELPQVAVEFDELTGLAGATELEPDVFANALETAIELLQRVGSAGESLGLAGLGEACSHLCTELEAARESRGVIVRGIDTWRALVSTIREYLHSPYDPARAGALAALLGNPQLAAALSAEGVAALTAKLMQPEFASVEVETRVRPQLAQPADVALDLPEDANSELVEALLQELPHHAEELSAAIQRLQNGGSLEDVTIAQRIAHTIKGAGNTVGVRGVAELTHQLEDILLALAKHQTLPTPDLSQTLSSACDCLQEMAEALQGVGPAPANSLQVLQQVLDWANRIDHEGPPASDSAPLASAAAPANEPQPDVEAAPAAAAERDAIAPMLRIPSTLIEELLRLVGEAMIQNSQLHERIRTTRQEARAMGAQFDLLQQLGTELEELIDLRDLAADRRGEGQRAFDALELDQYNELHTYSRRLIEAAVDAREIGRTMVDDLGELNEMAVTQERLNRDTQDVVLRTRMVPVKSAFPRLERTVRQTCRLTGKQVKLHLHGGDTQMDSDVLAQVVDPLMHVLRNAIDHGIEDEPLRSAAGKDVTGHITVEFVRDGNTILVRCRDDGAGLDMQAIRATAEQRGLVAPGSDCSDEMLKRLVLLPNFTTRQRATQTSGRGMGLDSVHSGVTALGGSLTLHSTAGQGCSVEIRLPVTLLSSHALLVRTAQQIIAITNRGLEEIQHVEPGAVQVYAGQLVYRSGEQLIPATPLDRVLALAPTADAPDAPAVEYRAALMVRSEAGSHAVLATEVIASRDLVIKSLGRYVPHLRGVVGATILGDGSVTAVIDLAEMLRAPAKNEASDSTSTTHTAHGNARQRRALVVDDSLSARRSLAQVLADAGYDVSTARDGMEAAELLEQRPMDILFVDMEMPRMNGIELTSHVRAHAGTAKLPVIMITSRSTEKHRAQAHAAGVNAYLTKPFDADMLLEEAEQLLGAA